MRRSLATRLFRNLFAVSLVTALLSIGAIEVFYEDMEDTILSLELTEEQAYFRKHIQGNSVQQWDTARLKAIFLPAGAPEDALPDYLKGKPAPYSGELELTEATYLVLVEPVDNPPGHLYLSQDISIMEGQELLSQLTVLGVLLGMALIGFVLSRLSARRLVHPLRKLTQQIQATEPAKTMRRLETEYQDTEFADIAGAFNRFLDALEAFVDREKSFVKLASHELRTPLAVMSGALEIIEKRNALSEADQRTLARIRRAANDMQADVNVLLKLARGHVDSDEPEPVSLARITRDTMADLENSQSDQPDRLRFDAAGDQTLMTDPPLLRMLIRNLLQNALKHTRGPVDIELLADGLRITDYGRGLPRDVSERLENNISRRERRMQESNFGLLLVQLICERQDWQLDIVGSGPGGTTMDVHFGADQLTPACK
ncbi:sensor histidine kinase [Marinobacter sp. JSM 1782161]|uniref:sensor histidine kinase n=1 Tax=Marinobacter sp. JSM 1782161 TaxID=2685906 RepID=UPI001403BBE9|nr:HAMP domain-containing sensor histidine kinase [Marinobacter sp. JSM 1782161]